MFCTRCGNSLASDATFCAGCGRRVEQRAPAIPVQHLETAAAPPQEFEQSGWAPPPPQKPQMTPPPQQQAPIYVTQQVQVTTPVMARPPKSIGLAILLAFLFGPFGLFYASVMGGFIMLVGGILFAIATGGVGGFLVWIGCMVWAGVAANNHNSALAASQAYPTQINR